MSTLEKRLDALEQVVRLFEAQRKAEGPILTVEIFQKIRRAIEAITERHAPRFLKKNRPSSSARSWNECAVCERS